MSNTVELTYTVADMTCGGCRRSVTDRLNQLPGVDSFDIDLATQRVAVRGTQIDDDTVREAIAGAGFQAVRVSDGFESR